MFTVNAFILKSERMHDVMEPVDLFAALIAGAAHDFKHDGVNNAFHVNTASELALRYNDASVLENMHSAELFLMCRDDSVNIFKTLEPAVFKEVRKIITGAILGTDMTKHFNHIADFESRLAAEKHLEDNPEAETVAGAEQRLDKRIMIEMALHCADISNPVKNIDIYKKWVVVVMEEFYNQGDRERDLGMPISAMFDRNNSSVKKTQSGFIGFIIKPIYKIWGEFIPELNETFTKNMDVGLAFDWDAFYEQAQAERQEVLRHKSIREDHEGEREDRAPEETGGGEGAGEVDTERNMGEMKLVRSLSETNVDA
jgi:cAMP-specific phosphodiesterase 4